MADKKSPVRQLAWDYYRGTLSDRNLYRRERQRLVDEMLGENSPPLTPTPTRERRSVTPVADDNSPPTLKSPAPRPKSGLLVTLIIIAILLAGGILYTLFRPQPAVEQEMAAQIPNSSALQTAAESLVTEGWDADAIGVFVAELSAAGTDELTAAANQPWYRNVREMTRRQITQMEALAIAGSAPSPREILLVAELGEYFGLETPDWSTLQAVPPASPMDLETEPVSDPDQEDAPPTVSPSTVPIQSAVKSDAQPPLGVATKEIPALSAGREAAKAQTNPPPSASTEQRANTGAGSDSARPDAPTARTGAAARYPTWKHSCIRAKADTRQRACRDLLSSKAAGPRMRILRPGNYLMGSDQRPAEQPRQEVTIGYPFAISTYEITQAEYELFCRATSRTCPTGSWTELSPVVNVTWHDANAYAGWLTEKTGKNYRLPSEAEWEYAARANTTTRYPFGDELLITRVRFSSTDKPVNSPVDLTYKLINPNSFKLYHMVGNVSEWVADTWSDSLPQAIRNGAAHHADSPFRVVRGGSYADGPDQVRSAYREKVTADHKSRQIGFRVVLAFNAPSQ